MSRTIKSLGLAIASIPISLALLGAMSHFGWIDPHAPSAWSTMKLIVTLLGGCSYALGLQWFKENKVDDG